jgi:hypothetical protein
MTNLIRFACPALAVALVLAIAPRAQKPGPIAPVPTPIAAPALPAQPAPPRVDVTSFGARAVAGFDNAPAFQAAHDALARRLAAVPGSRGSIYVPESIQAYDFASPLYRDAGRIDLESSGSGALLRSGWLSANGVTAVNCPVLADGFRRPSTIGGAYAASYATHRPDLAGKLDASIASATGQRWGFRTCGNAFILSHGSPLSHGGSSPRFGRDTLDNWSETQTLTIEAALEGFGTDGKIPPMTNLFGVGNDTGSLFPFRVLIDDSGQFKMEIQTQAARWGPPTLNYLSVASQAPGVQRLTIQVDLKSANVTAWLNGVQTYTGSYGLKPGWTLNANEDYPFCVGGLGIYESWQATVKDFAVYGLSLSRTLRYRVGANGSSQVRTADGQPYAVVRDVYRYDDDGSDRANHDAQTGLLGYFAFSEPPSPAQPMLSIPCGASTNFAAPAFIGSSGQLGMGGIQGYRLRNVRLESRFGVGTPLLIAHVLNYTAVDVETSGGFWGMACLPMQSNYPLTFERCTFGSHGDAAFYLCISIANMHACHITTGGRATMRLRETNLSVRDMFIAGVERHTEWSLYRHHIGMTGGGTVSLANVIQDIENEPYPARGVVGLERGPLGGCYRFTDVDAGRNGGTPVFLLESRAGDQPGWPANKVETDNLIAPLAASAVIATGPGWTMNDTAVTVGARPIEALRGK